jgi:glucokinase
MNYKLAVDIGGTQLRVALYPEEATQAERCKRIPTRGKGSAVERLIGLLSEIWPAEGVVTGIGVAAPGPIDPDKGIIFSAPNIPGWTNMPLQKHLEDAFHVPVHLGNDANLAVLGEWRYGAGRGHKDILFLTISTGIGGGVIIKNRLLLGSQGLAAELGHVSVDPNGPMCGCGQRGHLEAISSGTAIGKYVVAQLQQGRTSVLTLDPAPTGKDISSAAAAGDALAVEAVERAARALGVAIAGYLHIFNPSIVILGGGVSQSGPVFMEPMLNAMRAAVIAPAYVNDLVVTLAELGDNAGLMGALALAHSA